MTRRFLSPLTVALVALMVSLAGSPVWAQSPAGAIRVEVDETRAPQKILHTHLQMPVQPGPLALSYPEWIPGEHEPSGPIINMAGLKFMANGKALPWRRDLVDMFALHLDIPQGVKSLDIDFDFLLSAASSGYSAGASATAFLNVVSWNQLVLFPKGQNAANLTVVPSLRIPAGWKFGTALPGAKQSGDTIEFSPVSLETLIDSPVISGRYFRVVDLTPSQTPSHEIDIAADSPAALEMTPETEAHYKKLVAEANALFGSHHYRDYHFLLTLSENVAHFGLEHHESSDDRIYERSLTDPSTRVAMAILLPHEYVHSWNGKFRRPAGLLSPDYHQPMKDDLLWVYEGLTEYLEELLAGRTGLRSIEQEHEEIARVAALLDAEPGRQWRPLQDTADAAVFLYNAGGDWQNWRRATDFYPEGVYLWLDVDATIRRLTQDRKSINDFCRLFYGGTSGQPDLKPYVFEDVVAALNEIAPNDWSSFLRSRLDSLAPNTMDESLNNSGWKLVYNDTPNELQTDREAVTKSIDLSLSLGLRLAQDGNVIDVIYDGPSYKAGLGPGVKIMAVGGRQFSPESVNAAIKDAENGSAPIQLIAANGTDIQTYSVDYHRGFRYPHLARDESKSDFLSEALTPLAGSR